MIDNNAIYLALRARLLSLSVCTTGVTSLSATVTGYARAAGSFLTDGFARGMQITPAGFAANPVDVITDVTALTITVTHSRAAEGAAGGRSLTVGLPATRIWENVADTAPTGAPFIEEDYLPGPVELQTLGAGAILEALPQYVVRVYGLSNVGISAINRYADAILTLFAPKTTFTLPNGDWLRVRGIPGPFRGQLLPDAAGWVVAPVNVPLSCRSTNVN